MIGLLLAALLTLPASGAEFNLGRFCGLNDAQTPATLPECESPDLLNVEANINSTAILKRKGFAKSADLTIATSPVTGSHSFIDSSGNRKDIVCQDKNCAASTNGNAFSVIHSTSISGITRWSWVDVGGNAYGANNRYEKIIKYSGSSTSSPQGMPLGSILELTQDRLVVADITGSPNRVHYSSAGAYEQFTTGANSEDSWFDEIGAPGDRIRGLKFQNGILHIFKTSSITDCEIGDQYSTRCSVISPNIGTTDPGSIVTAGSCLYFRAQDKNYWQLCPQGLKQISQKIINLVKSQSGGLGGGEQSNTQTTQADWQAGVQSPTITWNTASLPGSIFPSSFTFIDTAGVDFGSGTLTGVTTQYTNGAVVLSSSSFIVYNGDFEQGTCSSGIYWTCTSAGSASCAFNGSGALMGSCGAQVYIGPTAGNGFVRILNGFNDAILAEKTYSVEGLPLFTGETFDLYALGLSTQVLKIQFEAAGGSDRAVLTSSTFTAISSVTWSGSSVVGAFGWGQLDDIRMNRYFSLYQASMTPVTVYSRIFDVGVTTVVGGPFVVDVSSPVGTGLGSFQMRSSPNGATSWTSWTTISSGTRNTLTGRFQQYLSTFTTSVGTTTPALLDVFTQYASTGFYTTQCIQPNSSISAWGTLSCAQTLAGNGSIVFYATGAATCAGLPSTDPGSWQTSFSNNATIPIITTTAVKIGWRSLLTSATDQAQIDACTLFWNEGTPVQPAWAVYDSADGAIYWTTTINGASSSNRLLKYDLMLDQWYPFDIPAQAPRMINNVLYFGGASSGTWNQYGTVDSDLGASINAYWKSKDIGSESPFLEKDFKTLSVMTRNNRSGSMSATWTNSIGNTGTYSVSLSTGAGINYARSNYYLPQKSPQNFMNVLFGNNNTTPFEILGFGLTWEVKPWRVSP